LLLLVTGDKHIDRHRYRGYDGGATDSGGAIRRPREPLNDVDCCLANGKRPSTVRRIATTAALMPNAIIKQISRHLDIPSRLPHNEGRH